MRGFNEIAPNDSYFFEKIRKEFELTTNLYGYDFVYLNLVEEADLYFRTSGIESDVCNKELFEVRRYKDEFRNWVLRPEGTASCMRFLKETNYLNDKKEAKFAYFGPMFRYNRPQKGRYRQFFHAAWEYIGNDSIYVDLETILGACEFLDKFDMKYELQINSIGSSSDRAEYRKVLAKVFDISEGDPLKILDKAENYENIPKMQINEKSAQKFEQLCLFLKNHGINFVINPYLIRGLDYYNDLVFEFVVNNQTVLAGGRYDSLMEQIDGPKTPAVGFAAGIDRIMIHANYQHINEKIAVIQLDETLFVFDVLKKLRKMNKNVVAFYNITNLKKILSFLAKENYEFVAIVGKTEEEKKSVVIKNLKNFEQKDVFLENLLF